MYLNNNHADWKIWMVIFCKKIKSSTLSSRKLLMIGKIPGDLLQYYLKAIKTWSSVEMITLKKKWYRSASSLVK